MVMGSVQAVNFVEPHKTAKARKRLSGPMVHLRNVGLLWGKRLDYGCGRGFDAEVMGFDAAYDPHFRPKLDRRHRFDIITCIYVLNVVSEEVQREIIADVNSLLLSDGMAYFAVRRDIPREGSKSQRWVTLASPAFIEAEERRFCIYARRKT